MTEDRFVAALARTLGDPTARREVRAMLAGGPIELPPDALGGCVDSRIDPLAVWDPGFDFEASFAARRVQRVRPGSAAERAGLRDGQTLVGANVYRGDVTKPIMLRVRADSTEQRISYPSASERTVRVQVLTWRGGC
jgi:predicted metalloprotease with PDZ domain